MSDLNPHGLTLVTEDLLVRLLERMRADHGERPASSGENAAVLERLIERMRLEGITPVGMLLVPDTFDGLVRVAQTMLERHYPREHVLGDAFLSYLRAALDCLEDPRRLIGRPATAAVRRRKLADALRSSAGRSVKNPKKETP